MLEGAGRLHQLLDPSRTGAIHGFELVALHGGDTSGVLGMQRGMLGRELSPKGLWAIARELIKAAPCGMHPPRPV